MSISELDTEPSGTNQFSERMDSDGLDWLPLLKRSRSTRYLVTNDCSRFCSHAFNNIQAKTQSLPSGLLLEVAQLTRQQKKDGLLIIVITYFRAAHRY